MMVPNPCIIRAAMINDLEDLVLLCHEHAHFEGVMYDLRDKKLRLREHLFGEADLQCLVVEVDHQLVGYATFIKQFSTWNARYYLYLDCIYLRSDARGKGLGRRLMKCIRDYASDHNLLHLEWQTPIHNKAAIYFYGRLGATPKSKIRFSWC